MCQNPSLPPPPPLKEDNELKGLPGCRLIHTIHLVSRISPDIVDRAAAHFKAACAPVNRWAVIRRGGLLEQKIDLDDMSERQAKLLCTHLLTFDDVLRVRLEHRFVPQRSGSDPASRPSIA